MFLLRHLFTVLFVCLLGSFSMPLAVATPGEAPQRTQEDQLIVATKTPRGPLSKKELKKYLSGQLPTWPDEEPVTIVLFPKKSPELVWLCKTHLKIPPATYRRFLMQKAFRSGINIIEVQNQEEARTILQEKPGAIAPIDETSLGEELHPVVVQ